MSTITLPKIRMKKIATVNANGHGAMPLYVGGGMIRLGIRGTGMPAEVVYRLLSKGEARAIRKALYRAGEYGMASAARYSVPGRSPYGWRHA